MASAQKKTRGENFQSPFWPDHYGPFSNRNVQETFLTLGSNVKNPQKLVKNSKFRQLLLHLLGSKWSVVTCWPHDASTFSVKSKYRLVLILWSWCYCIWKQTQTKFNLLLKKSSFFSSLSSFQSIDFKKALNQFAVLLNSVTTYLTYTK